MNPNLTTSRELSLRLKEAGVKQESEYVWAKDGTLFSDGNVGLRLNHNDGTEECCAYLSGELGELLPERYLSGKIEQRYNCWAFDENWQIINYNKYQADTLVEAMGLMLEHLIKNKLMGVRG